MLNNRFFFDMDGTIADLYSVENWLEKLNASDPSPYADAVPMVDMEKLNEQIERLKSKDACFGVISWLAGGATKDYDKIVRQVKKDWLKVHLPAIDKNIHIVKYGQQKHYVVSAAGAVLFDDNEKVGRAWEKAGGVWVDVKTTKIEDFLASMA